MLFSNSLILFALKLRRILAKLSFPAIFQTWKKYVFLRYLLNYAYDFDKIMPTNGKHFDHLKFEIKNGGHQIASEDIEESCSIFSPFSF